MKSDEMKKVMQEALDPEYMGKFPQSAKAALDQMCKMIMTSDNPADVALSMSLGLAYVLYCSSNPEKTLAIMLAAATKISEKVSEMDTGDLQKGAGAVFFEKMKENLK